MAIINHASRLWDDLGRQPGRSLLFFLLLVDMLFIVLHCLRIAPWFDYPRFSLASDMGYPEIFQYIKELWISLSLAWVACKSRCMGYVFWSLLFLYVLLDDYMEIHEILGSHIAQTLALPPLLGLHGTDMGELAVSVISALFLFPPLILFFLYGSRDFRRVSCHLATLFSALVFFGIFVDMIHAILTPFGRFADYSMELIEESGEMFVMSFLAWYAYALQHQEQTIHPNRSRTSHSINLFN